MQIFSLSESHYIARPIAEHLGTDIAALEERNFEDGECKIRPLVSVRGQDVYVVQSLHGGPDLSGHDKLCRLLFLMATLRDHGAARVTTLIPYLAYARKDRQTKLRDPVTTRYVALLIEAVGCDRVVTLDVHNLSAFQNAFRCETVHLDTRLLFAKDSEWILDHAPVTVASPDPGGVKRAQLFRETLERHLDRSVGFAFMEKRRSLDVVTGSDLAGDVNGATVIVIDDMIASGGTMVRAAVACLEAGARSVNAYAAHGLFVGDAESAIAHKSIDAVVITDSIPPMRLRKGAATPGLKILSVAPMFAEAIKQLSENGSVSARLGGPD